ncbi:octaprenyl-diphosphate synthase [Bacteroidia bacterium]|nr:octaprenyl-diphosphate synthase [Bacteroidia bacterium]GHU87439.1 octaprenyl-diphosphate synthase [Bacteroidia bacterium]
MSKRNAIVKPVEKEMEAFNQLYKKVLQGHSSDFQSMIDYVNEANGKRIRPLISLLTAKVCGETNQKTVDYAVVLELLHTATLIHDDVVDDTKIRRGRPSANARYDNRVAVLLGDYILSIAIVRAVMSQSLQILGIISNLAQNLAEGELSQLISSDGKIISEERYFDIIRKKTAVLLSSCSEMGALSVGANKQTIENFRLFGEYLGICFQIRDDIFDYFEQGDIGKPTGNDIREGKVTLPLIHALHTAPKEEAAKMLKLIRESNFTINNIQLLINFAKEFKGIEYAETKMKNIRQQALALLDDFPETEAKKALIELVDYVIERRK